MIVRSARDRRAMAFLPSKWNCRESSSLKELFSFSKEFDERFRNEIKNYYLNIENNQVHALNDLERFSTCSAEDCVGPGLRQSDSNTLGLHSEAYIGCTVRGALLNNVGFVPYRLYGECPRAAMFVK